MKRIVLFSIMLALFSCSDGEKKGFADIVPDSDRTGIQYDSNGYGLRTCSEYGRHAGIQA